jgi:soluble lytic murein transglycosylase-like protein
MPRCTSLLLITSIVCSGGLSAEVYKITGRDGQVLFTNNKREKGRNFLVRTPTRESSAINLLAYSTRMFLKHNNSNARSILGKDYIQVGPFDFYINKMAVKYDVDPDLIHAVIKAESGYRKNARSYKGAQGLMQLMPGTAERLGVEDAYDPQQNIEGGTKYLAELLKLFDYKLPLVVAAYNAGEHNVIKHGYRIPPFPETEDYVDKVLDYYNGNPPPNGGSQK